MVSISMRTGEVVIFDPIIFEYLSYDTLLCTSFWDIDNMRIWLAIPLENPPRFLVVSFSEVFNNSFLKVLVRFEFFHDAC